ncbi:MAG TPA: 30S ribosomal protein S3 [Candidatus Paceibacterota bacterium]
MSHSVHPYAHRLVELRDWKSRWFGQDRKEYTKLLKIDVLVRQFLQKRMKGMQVASLEFERSQKQTKLIIKTGKPGAIIGRGGDGIQKIRQDIATFIRKQKLPEAKEIVLDIVEVQNPEADAAIVGQTIAEMLEKRMTFRRVMKQMAEKVMQARGVKGVRIVLSGRLGGADMSRVEEIHKGSIPLQFIRADIDFARERANMSYGVIGIKVWIYKGDSLTQAPQQTPANKNA